MDSKIDSPCADGSTPPVNEGSGRALYVKPQIIKKRSVSRVTLTSGGSKGGASGGLIGSGRGG